MKYAEAFKKKLTKQVKQLSYSVTEQKEEVMTGSKTVADLNIN